METPPSLSLHVGMPPGVNFTHKQGQYLAFIYYYTKIHRVPPAEAEMQRYLPSHRRQFTK